MKTAHQLYERHQVNPLSDSEIEDFVDKLGLANAAILAGDEKFIGEISRLLSEAEVAFVDFRRAQLSILFFDTNHLLFVIGQKSTASSCV